MSAEEKLCRDIYAETKAFDPVASLCRDKNMTFEILLGPPFKHPTIAFIGYQPGEGEMSPSEARARGYEDDWVTQTCQFAGATWPLARHLRAMFGEETLSRCVGLNAIFMRAKSITDYVSKVARGDRERIRDFCLLKVQTILRALEPRNLIIIGFETLNLFCRGEPCLQNERRRILIKKGHVFGHIAYATLHLSGARISNSDRQKMAQYLNASLQWPTPGAP